MRALAETGILVLSLALFVSPGRAQEQLPPVTPEARDAALAKAFEFLDRELPSLQSLGSPRRQYAIAVTGWAYLLAADKAEGGGKRLPSRKKQIDRFRQELLRYAEQVAREYDRDDKKQRKNKKKGKEKGKQGPASGPPGFPAGFDAFKPAQYTWPLSVAAHFFAESAARGKGRRQAREGLALIAKVLEASQQENGGWGHDDMARPGMGLPPIRIPKPGGGEFDYPGTLLAASHCALSGLGTACRALKSKKKTALERGRKYFAAAQNGDGTFPYDPRQKHDVAVSKPMAGGIEVARTAGALFALYCAGAAQDDPVSLKGLAAIDKTPELLSEGHGSATMALQFGALLSRARGDQAWTTFRNIFLPRILAHQEASGAFTCVCAHESPAVTCDTRGIPGMPAAANYVEGQKIYVTAIHALILLLDRGRPRVLPKVPAPRPPQTGK